MKARIPPPSSSCWLALLLISSVAAAAPVDLDRLLAGVDRIAVRGVPGPIALVGPDAFAVVGAGRRDASRHAAVAAATAGRGRVVAFGHGGYLDVRGETMAGNRRLVLNVVSWLAPEKKRPRVGLVRHGSLRSFLEESGMRTETLTGSSWAARLEDVDILVLGEWDLGGRTGEERLARFVANGGGLITDGLAWGWKQLHPDRRLERDHRLNSVLAGFGLYFADGYLKNDPIDVRTDRSALDSCHAGRALGRLSERKAPEARESGQIAAVLTTALVALPEDHPAFRERVAALVAKRAEMRIPTERAPIRSRAAIARLGVLLDHLDAERAPVERVRAAPSAVDFPGGVPDDAAREKAIVPVDLSVPGWASTGLYAPPGEVVTISIPDGVPVAGLRIRIGCHTDRLWDKAAWKRHPEVSRAFELDGRETRVAHPHGGLVYLVAPKGRKGRVEVTIAGAVRAPLYVLGRTDAEAWKREIRNRPGPWAELATSKVILTVRSEDVRGLDDPEALMRFWDGALDLYSELGRRPLARRPQRIVCDRQISAGYMHSGYPIMTLLDQSDRMTSLEKLRAGAWGLWHELGHNHQRREWTFGGTTEVTCNLFSLFVEERVRGLKPAEHPWPKPKWKKVVAHFEEQGTFERWKRDPGLALWTYILVQDEFGWKPFQEAFEAYARMGVKSPKTDDEKRDAWLERLSRATGRNLGPYFTAWRIPTSKVARDRVSDLPVWMPERIKPLLR